MPRNPVTSKAAVLQAAIPLAAQNGFQNVRRQDLARALDVADGTISNMFSTMPKLRRAIVGECISLGADNPDAMRVLAQALAIRDSRAAAAPQHLKDAAAKLLTA